VAEGDVEARITRQDEYGASLLAVCLQTLREREADPRARGILHAAIFGSVAKGTAHAGSDIDVIVDVQLGAGFGIFELTGLKLQLEQVLGRHVDIMSLDALQSPKHDDILLNMVRAF
jgi:predicted nucleotidyltransferase